MRTLIAIALLLCTACTGVRTSASGFDPEKPRHHLKGYYDRE